MLISNDLKFLNKDNINLVYNYECNSGIVVNNTIQKFLKEKDTDSLEEYINEDTKKALVNANVIFYNNDYYKDKIWTGKYIKDKYEKQDLNINFIYFHVTNRCNLNCEYCYQKENLTTESDNLKTEDIFKIIDKFDRFKIQKIVFTGGECTLRNDLIDILRYCMNKGIHTEIITNGVNLYNNVYSFDLLESVDKLTISLDSFNDNHNLRKGLNINKLREYLISIPVKYSEKISINTVISDKNLDDYEEILEFCKTYNFKSKACLRMPNKFSDIDCLPDKNYLKNKLEFTTNENIGCSNCSCGLNIISLDQYGNIYLCQSLMKKELVLANIFDNNWEEKLMEKINKINLLHDISYTNENCKKCEVKHICRGGCPAIRYNLFKSFIEVEPEFCKYLQIVSENKLINSVKSSLRRRS